MAEATPIEDKPKHKKVKVMAPATLAEGATFVAEVDGVQFTAQVPRGGVQKGEIFKTRMDETTIIVAGSGPEGRWRTDLFDCCDNSTSDCCALCCMAFNFPFMISAQIIQRLNLTLGGCRKGGSSARPKKGMSACVLYPSVAGILLLLPLIIIIVASAIRSLGWLITGYFMYFALFVWIAFIFVASVCTRKSMRELYKIPGSCCADFCVTYWCYPCVAIQMARHTHDPKKHPYNCCSITGLSPDAPQCDVV